MSSSTLITPDGAVKLIRPLVGFQAAMEAQLRKYPYERNVFLMLRFRDSNRDLSDFILETLQQAGLNGVRADQPDWNITNNLYNPVACLYCCKFGIALFDEAEDGQVFNPNVIYELGIMHSLDRDCLILKNANLPNVPFDLTKDLHMAYKSDLVVRTNVRNWLQKVMPSYHAVDSVDEKRDSGLEIAAAEKDGAAASEIVSVPDGLEASDLSWRLTASNNGAFTIQWAIQLKNNRAAECSVKVQVLFTSKDGFALDDQISDSATRLRPGEAVKHESVATMDAGIVDRIAKIYGTVLEQDA